jgi:hypothetical protein
MFLVLNSFTSLLPRYVETQGDDRYDKLQMTNPVAYHAR